MLKNQAPFYLLVLSALIGLTVPVLIRDGMFMDAVLYTSVAHNMSEGFGSFWFPQFSMHNVFGQAAFHEQPPLGFWLMSLPFRIFGDSMYIERAYTFFMLLINATLIVILWRKINRDNDYKKLGWLPVLFWITIPEVFWSFSNNMLENTMSVFILLSAIFMYDAFSQNKFSLVKLLSASIFIFCATMVKGIPGLFVISMPGLYWLITKRISFRNALVSTVFILIIITSIYSLLLINASARESLRIYFFDRALFRIGENPTVNSRFYILGSLIQQLAGQIIFCLIIFIAGRKKSFIRASSDDTKTALFFIVTGICGSLPLMLTLVQKAFYYVPSLSFFAIGFAILTVPAFKFLGMKIGNSAKYNTSLYFLSAVFLISAILFSLSKVGQTGRNKEVLSDIHQMGSFIPDHSCVTVPQRLWNDWQLQTYMMRNYSICLDPAQDHDYYISKKDSLPQRQEYTNLILRGKKYDLYSLPD